MRFFVYQFNNRLFQVECLFIQNKKKYIKINTRKSLEKISQLIVYLFIYLLLILFIFLIHSFLKTKKL